MRANIYGKKKMLLININVNVCEAKEGREEVEIAHETLSSLKVSCCR